MNHLEIVRKKIVSQEQLDHVISFWKFKGLKVAFTNGCFDILHQGHIDYLAKAKDMADILIIGLNSDSSVKRLKGNHRPINNEESRGLILASLLFVDNIVIFDEETPYELIKKIQPSVLIKGSDYKAEDIVGYDIVKANGGQVVTLDFLPGFSTTGIEQKIKNS